MKLYEISNEVKNLNDLYLDAINGDGVIEDVEVLEELEKGIMQVLENKGTGIIKVFQNENLMINGIDEEIKRLQAMKKNIKNKQETFKRYIINNMEKMGIKKIETPLGNLSLRESTTTEIYDNSLIADKFRVQVVEYKYDKTGIKKAIKNGEEVQGARLITNLSLNIK